MSTIAVLAVKAAVVVAAALIGAGLLHRRSAALRHWILAVGIACAALIPALHVVAPSWTLPVVWNASSRSPAVAPVSVPSGDAATGESASIRPASVRGTQEPRRLSIGQWLTALWGAGTFAGVLILGAGLLRLSWLAARSPQITSGAWTETASEIGAVYQLRRPLRLLQSQHPSMLVTWGVWRPVVLLPRDARDWSADRRRIVLAHELAHVARGDWLAQLAAAGLRAAYWFNPLVWIAGRSLRHHSERACDDLAVDCGVDRAHYAAELVALARTLRAERHAWIPAPAMARQSNLERRVTAMLNQDLNRRPPSARVRVLIAASFLAVALAAGGFTLFAQSFSSYSGAALDQVGGRVANVTLTLTNRQSGQKYEVKTNGTGGFEFVGLIAGEYELRTSMPGFKTTTSALTMDGRGLQRDVQLAVGSLEETITVTSQARPRPAQARPRPRSVAPATSECVAQPIGGVIRQPTKILDKRPVYPTRDGAVPAGVIVLDAEIGPEGTVTEAKPVDANADPDLVAAAVEAVLGWRYTPTLLNCVPITVQMKVTVAFKEE